MAATTETVETVADVTGGEYKYGFVTDVETDSVAPGLNEDVIRLISGKKGERIVYVRTLIEGDGESRSIEAITTGQYL